MSIVAGLIGFLAAVALYNVPPVNRLPTRPDIAGGFGLAAVALLAFHLFFTLGWRGALYRESEVAVVRIVNPAKTYRQQILPAPVPPPPLRTGEAAR